MEMKNFAEAIKKTELPFVYSGNKLDDDNCQNVIKKVNTEGTVLGVITGYAAAGFQGLIVTEKGIWFNHPSGGMKTPKTNGALLFDVFILSNVTVKQGFLQTFNFEFVIYDPDKGKSFTFEFTLDEDNIEINKPMSAELEEILKTLITKTGMEYEPVKNKEPNIFNFIWDDVHANIVLNDDNVIITKLKIDEKTSIQTPIDAPITISRSSIASVKKGKNFSPLTLFKFITAGIGIFIASIILISFWVGLVGFILCFILGIILAFPTTLVIKRKDGTKFVTRLNADEENTVEYERLMNVIFK